MTEFIEISVVIVIASVLGIIATKLKQPTILGFILAGLFIGPILTMNIHTSSIELFSKIGITFLLFVVGLELDIKELKNLGKVVFTTSIGQMIFTTAAGFILVFLLGFDVITSLYVSVALTFSSTIIIVKLLSSKKELDTLHGKISLGFLLVQDFIAMFILIAISAFTNLSKDGILVEVLMVVFKTIAIGALIVLISKFCLPFILKYVNKDQETLFIFVIAYCLLISAFVGSDFIKFSPEIGALLAGISLASSYEHLQIESWMKPLRDFFILMFFVFLGLGISINSIGSVIIPALILSVFVIVGNPILMMFIMGAFGFHKRVIFLTSLAVGQVSEFSLLLIALGKDKGLLAPEIVTLVTIVGAITMVASSYMFIYSDQLYEKLKNILGFFHFRKKLMYDYAHHDEHQNHIIILGCDKTGRNILHSIKDKDRVLVVDYNPKNIEYLNKNGIKAMFGDIKDVDIYSHLNLENASCIISTVPNMISNKVLLNILGTLEKPPVSILVAKDEEEIHTLYNLGANYVVFPYLLTGQKISTILKNNKKDDYMNRYREVNFKTI